MGTLDEAKKEFGKLMSDAYKGTKRDGSSKFVNAIANNFLGGAELVGNVLDNQGMKSIEKTFAKGGASENGWDMGKIAGSYLGVAAAGRVLTGGGVYKDGNGNTNLVGVPFV